MQLFFLSSLNHIGRRSPLGLAWEFLHWGACTSLESEFIGGWIVDCALGIDGVLGAQLSILLLLHILHRGRAAAGEVEMR